jgi:hypothetical protein
MISQYQKKILIRNKKYEIYNKKITASLGVDKEVSFYLLWVNLR